jgi:hypothetical protein
MHNRYYYEDLVDGSPQQRLIAAISSLKTSSKNTFEDKAKILDEVKECINEIIEQKGEINCSHRYGSSTYDAVRSHSVTKNIDKCRHPLKMF